MTADTNNHSTNSTKQQQPFSLKTLCSGNKIVSPPLRNASRRVAEIQIFEKTHLIVIKDETGLKFKMNDSTLFLIGSYAQKLVASY